LKKLLYGLIGFVVVLTLVLAGILVNLLLIAPKPPTAIDTLTSIADTHTLPPLQTYSARDGAALAFRQYPGAADRIVVLLHGHTGSSVEMDRLARGLSQAGYTVLVPDIRGHGASGSRGDIAYLGQLDDDLTDLMISIRKAHPTASVNLVGFDAGGGLALRFDGGEYGGLFDRYVLLAPYLGFNAPTVRAGLGGKAAVSVPRLFALAILDKLGIHRFDTLPVVAFAIPSGNPDQTPTYTMRLWQNFGPDLNYRGDFNRATKPIIILDGTKDEVMVPNQFAPNVTWIPSVKAVYLLPGLNHRDLIVSPTARDAILAVLRGGAPKGAASAL